MKKKKKKRCLVYLAVTAAFELFLQKGRNRRRKSLPAVVRRFSNGLCAFKGRLKSLPSKWEAATLLFAIFFQKKNV
jgi:hypothetical protein